MRQSRIFPGIILVFVGVAFLLNSMGVLHFHWRNFFYLWPLFIIIAGINLILGHNNAPWALPLRIIVVVVCLSLLLFGNFGRQRNFGWFNYHNQPHDRGFDLDNGNDNDDDDDDDDNDNGKATNAANSVYSEPWEARTKVAILNIEGGGTHYTLTDTTNTLLTAHTTEYTGNYDLDQNTTDSVTSVDFRLRGNNHNAALFSGKSNTVNLKLNSTPVWDIHVKGGADELDFDLSKFKVRNLKLDGGATDYTVKMGMPIADTHVDISTGVSDITIKVPAGAACDVITKSGLSSSNIDGMNKVGDNHYQSANFNAGAHKIYVYFKGGVSDFKVIRY